MNKNSNIIMVATGITELQYGNMVFESAQEWMLKYFGTEPTITKALNASKFFWAWWGNQWDNRDTAFVQLTGLNKISLPLDATEREVTIELYHECHSVQDLKIQPNRFVIREVDKLTKIEENKIKKLNNGKY